MARQWMTPEGFVIDEDGEDEYMLPVGFVVNEDQAAAGTVLPAITIGVIKTQKTTKHLMKSS